jgi:cytidylate kinase
MSSHTFHVAIDGPVAAGKGTVSRLVAERLQYLYVDTGAMYRVTAYLALQNNIPYDNEAGLVELLKKTSIEMYNPSSEEKDGRLTTVKVDGEDVSWKIRTEEVSAGSSQVAQLKHVREVLVEKQQQIAQGQDVVMEGRDITYRVLPEAEMKIFLTGQDVIRAKRRHLQLQTRGTDVGFEEVFRELIKRDKQDMERGVDPLKIVPEAWVIDTTDLSIDQVVDLIVAKVHVMRESHE